MDKKLLICGSPIAVVVLVLASFSPVVGYNSVESSARDSPLFHLRTQRAIDREQNVQRCTYLGKEKITNFLFPTRNNNRASLQRLIQSISRMNDAEFKRFIDFITNQLKNDDSIQDKNIAEVIYALSCLRTNPSEISDYLPDETNGIWTETNLYTTEEWKPGCILYSNFLDILEILILLFALIVFVIIPSIKNPNEPTVCDYNACLTYWIAC